MVIFSFLYVCNNLKIFFQLQLTFNNQVYSIVHVYNLQSNPPDKWHHT